VFIDCPPGLGLLTLNALVAADAVLVPLQAEFFALEGISQLMRTIEMVKRRLNPELAWRGSC
jgi:chromosome partitioning protein